MINFLNFDKKNCLNRVIIFLFYISALAFFLYLSQIYDFLFKPSKSINVYTFTDFITLETIQKFKNKTGIKVNLKYFDTNEEFLAKFKLDKGKDYDLATCSDNIVEVLKKDNLVQKIDKRRLKSFDQIDKRLLKKYFDLNNDFSIPYFWSTYGIIFNKKVFSNVKVNWDFVFNDPNLLLNTANNKRYKICMLDNARESISLSSIYLFNKVRNLSNTDLKKIKNLLVEQGKWVDVYMFASLQYYLLGKVVPLAVTANAFAKRILELSDNFDFVLPEKGSLLVIDNIVIPKKSKKLDMVYKFINFILSEEVQAKNSKEFGYNPANQNAYSKLDDKIRNNKAFFPDEEMFSKLHLINNEIKDEKIEKLWLKVQVGN